MRELLAVMLCACALVAGSQQAAAQYRDPGDEKVLTKVADVLMNPVDDQKVVIRGRIVRKLSNEKFMFTDETGEVRVDIDEELFGGRQIAGDSMIEIRGEVEKDFMSTPEIDVEQLRVIAP